MVKISSTTINRTRRMQIYYRSIALNKLTEIAVMMVAMEAI